VHEIVYGVSRFRGRLDHLLARKLKRGLGSLDPRVHEILRLGAYQVLYMDGVPRYAQAVTQARETAGAGSAKLVNAVLRGVAEDGDGKELFPDEGAEPVAFLCTWGSHPRWLVERWLRHWPLPDVRHLVETNNGQPGIYLVPLEGTPEEAVVRLADAGIAARLVGRGTPCVRLGAGADPAAALSVLPSVVQDPGASLVARYADPPPGTMVADLCAAPGGKALALSVGASYVVAADRSEVRMRMVRENVARTGRRVGLLVADARHPPIREAQVVFLDVPCTGTGTLKRHPDGRWRLQESSVHEMVAVQRHILDAGAKLVPPGGHLVYSTCSLEREENEDQVRAFLRRHPDFDVEATGAVPEHYVDGLGCLEVLPHRSGFDGAYAARMRRAG
jgi:16S rRNA (cytosine967-C5)-methyltransferase